jgi:hypothetical protein
VGAFVLIPVVGVGVMAGLYSSVVGDVPPYHFRLPGSTWAVESVDGVAVGAPAPRLVLDEDADTATLVLGCGELPLDWYWDSDGNGVGFTAPIREAACRGTPGEASLLAALTSTEEWRVAGDQAINVIGNHPPSGTVRLVLADWTGMAKVW